jgi:hypothetical protein
MVVFIKKYLLFPIAIGASKEPNFPGVAVKQIKKPLYRGVGYHVYSVLQYIQFSFDPTSQNNQMSIICVPGELFSYFKYKFLAKSPTGPNNTFIFQMSNDWVGYLYPIQEYIIKADYEPFASITAQGGEAIKLELYRLWREIEANIIQYS